MKYIISATYSALLLIATLIIPNQSQAAHPYEIYVEPNLTYEKIKIPNGEFKTWLGGATIGFDVTDKLAIVGSFATGVQDDSINNLTVDIDSMTNIYLRYGNSIKRSYRVYFLLGQSQSKVSYANTTDTLEDLSWGIGVEEKFKTFTKLYYKLEYIQHYKNDSQSLSGLNFGVRYNLK